MGLNISKLNNPNWSANLAEACENLQIPVRVSGDTNIYANVEFLSDATVDEETLTAKRDELAAEWSAYNYARNRKEAYPSIADQLDMQYHDKVDGTTTWQDAIQAVKDATPKA